MYIQYTVDPTACLWLYFSMHEVHTLLQPPGVQVQDAHAGGASCSLVSSNSLYLIRLAVAGSGPLRVRRTVVDVLCMCMHTLRSTQPHFSIVRTSFRFTFTDH